MSRLPPSRKPLPSYTFGMKTAISVPNDLFADAERLARRLKKSRSRLYAEAVAEYVARHDADAVTAKLDDVLGEPPEGDQFVDAASRATLGRTEW